jgi:hypothetical protein
MQSRPSAAAVLIAILLSLAPASSFASSSAHHFHKGCQHHSQDDSQSALGVFAALRLR